MFLIEQHNNVIYDDIETITWKRHIEEEYDEDDEGNMLSATLYDIEMTDRNGNISYFDNLTEEELFEELSNYREKINDV